MSNNLCEEQQRTANYTGELLNRFKFCQDESDCAEQQAGGFTNIVSIGQTASIEVLNVAANVITLAITPVVPGNVPAIVTSINNLISNVDYFRIFLTDYSTADFTYTLDEAMRTSDIVSVTNLTTYAELVIDLSTAPTRELDCEPFYQYSNIVNRTNTKFISADPVWAQNDSGTLQITGYILVPVLSPVMPVKIVCKDSKLETGVNTVTAGLVSASAAGNTSASLAQLSITNVGGTAGTIAGVAFPAGATVTYTAYYDNFTNEFKRIDSIAYDATGTTFLISETP